jgi:hypothetical protein
MTTTLMQLLKWPTPRLQNNVKNQGVSFAGGMPTLKINEVDRYQGYYQDNNTDVNIFAPIIHEILLNSRSPY